MKRVRFAVCALAGCLMLSLTSCGLLPRQTDAADEAILRVITLHREGEKLVLTAVTAGIQTGESSEPPETVEGRGSDYWSARNDLKRQREASLVHTTDWIVEQNALGDLLNSFVEDPELTYAAHIYILKDQSVSEFLAAFSEDETGPARALADLDRAPGIEGLTALKCSARLAAGECCEIPALRAENGKAHLDGTVEVTGWK